MASHLTAADSLDADRGRPESDGGLQTGLPVSSLPGQSGHVPAGGTGSALLRRTGTLTYVFLGDLSVFVGDVTPNIFCHL